MESEFFQLFFDITRVPGLDNDVLEIFCFLVQDSLNDDLNIEIFDTILDEAKTFSYKDNNTKPFQTLITAKSKLEHGLGFIVGMCCIAPDDDAKSQFVICLMDGYFSRIIDVWKKKGDENA